MVFVFVNGLVYDFPEISRHVSTKCRLFFHYLLYYRIQRNIYAIIMLYGTLYETCFLQQQQQQIIILVSCFQ